MPTSQVMISPEGIQKKNLNLCLICLALVLLTIIAFWPVKNCDFINMDDGTYVYENTHIRQGMTWKSIQWAFSFEYTNATGHWVPITYLSLILDHAFFGFNPHGYHITNLFFHILNTILLFLILHRMTKALWPSAFVAALFAIHPLHVESVAWVTERKDVLSTFFWMLTMGTYVLYTERKTIGRYILTMVFFILGLLSKSMLVTLPLVLILLDYWPLNRFPTVTPDNVKRGKRIQVQWLVWEKVPFLILAVYSSFVAYLSGQNANAIQSFLPLAYRIVNALRSYIIYITKMVWPHDLSILYPLLPGFPIWQIICAMVAFILITLFSFQMRKLIPSLMVGWLWYLGTLIPVIGIIQAGGQAYADRYTYVSLTGLFIMLAWGIPEFMRGWRYRKEVFILLSVFSLLYFSIVTWIQVGYWQNSITLFDHALTVDDRNPHVYNNRGLAYERLGNHKQAIRDYVKAIDIDPTYADAYNNRALSYYKLGNEKFAIEDLQTAALFGNEGAKNTLRTAGINC